MIQNSLERENDRVDGNRLWGRKHSVSTFLSLLN